jgi:hypothetical protein
MKSGFFTVRRHKEWHKEFVENAEKQAKTVETVETMKNCKRNDKPELRQW